MNIEKLIHDLRARINPQYYDQLGTESYERHQVVKALEYLQQENERLKADAEKHKSIPVRFVSHQHIRLKVTDANPNPVAIHIISERDGAWLDMPQEKIDVMRIELQSAIDAARGAK